MIFSEKKLKMGFIIALFLASFVTIKPVTSCTNFTVSYGDKVFFGNNEDWYDPNTFLWFNRHGIDDFGGVYVGYADFFPQGGMNEKGLCYDANALPSFSLTPHPELPYPDEWVVSYLLKKCSTVAEVIEKAQQYNWGSSLAYQVHFADASGDAVVISAGTDRELNFTRKVEGDGYLLATNFNLANPENGWTPCWRYNTATDLLNAINHADNLTLDAVRDILYSVHQKGTYATKYSNIFDLVKRDIYIYANANFKRVVRLNLDEELAREKLLSISISELLDQESSETSELTDQESSETSELTDQESSETSELELTSSVSFILMVFTFVFLVAVRKKR